MTQPDNSTLSIRDAQLEELDEVALVIKAAYQEYAPHFPAKAWEDYVRNMTDVRGRLGDSELIVAERAGHILGAVTFYPDGSCYRQQKWPTDWAAIRLLAIHPESRRQGIARALMLECLQRCHDRGIATLGLHTTEVMIGAQKLYNKMGFVRVQEFDSHPRPGLIIMAYRLHLSPTRDNP